MQRRTQPITAADALSDTALPDAALSDTALAETHAGGEAARSGSGPIDPPAASRSAETQEAPAYGVVTGEQPEGTVEANGALPPLGEQERYQRGPLLGRGGMGEVALQLDRRIGRQVAQKTLREDVRSHHALARFVREVRVQGQLEHPAIVPVYDFGTTSAGLPFFTMKRVRGQTLAAILERLGSREPEAEARYSRRKLLAAFAQVCLAVEYAHKRGVIHRDLKPGNVMLGDFGEVYVLDWGLAKLFTDSAGKDFEGEGAGLETTRAGDVVGTPLYMAPEQLIARGGGVLDPRVDVFALGAILFEILTLRSYRRGESMASIVLDAAKPRAERPSERGALDVPPELDEICALALAPAPAARLGSALAVAEAVERYLEGDRDLSARRALAARLVASARARLEERGKAEPAARATAMREAMKAIALAPEDPDAQRLLLSMVVDGSSELPPEAEREFEEEEAGLRAHGLRLGMVGYLSWLLSLPLAIWIGVRSWPIPAALTGLTLVCLAFAFVLLRRGGRDRGMGPVLAALSVSIIALSSGWLGPFVLVPVAACATLVMFMVHSSAEERRKIMAIYAVGAAIPFAVERLGFLPPAYSFREGELVLHARILELPRGLTVAALEYTSLSFLLLLGYFVGRMRDRQREAERRLFAQAWHLRQLFPARAEGGEQARAKGASK